VLGVDPLPLRFGLPLAARDNLAFELATPTTSAACRPRLRRRWC
jgi:hypothetical protein